MAHALPNDARDVISQFLIAHGRLQTANVDAPLDSEELVRRSRQFSQAYQALADLLSPLDVRRIKAEDEAKQLREKLSRKYLLVTSGTQVIAGLFAVRVDQWHNRPKELKNEIAYYFDKLKANAGEDAWHVVVSTDQESSTWYGVGLRGYSHFTGAVGAEIVFVSERNYQMLAATWGSPGAKP
jgi:hypothetical protein